MKYLKQLLKPLTHHKFLLLQLTQREIKARYKQSFIGYAWVLLNPLAQMLVYSFIFSVIFRFPTNDIPYPVYLFAALLPWTNFQNILSYSANALVANAILLRKVAFPREIIIYSVVVSKVIDFLFSSLVFFALVLFFKVPLALTLFMFIPLFLLQTLLVTGLSLLLSAFNLFFRDVQYLTNLLLMMWMYMTPIVYPLSMVPDRYVKLYKLNPMVGIVEGYRSALFGYPFEWGIIIWSTFWSVATFLIGFLVFKKLEKYFADIV
jgi:lipopolysaccharide transport system permease protein